MKKITALILAFITAFVLSISAFALTTNSVIPTATLNKILTEYREALKKGEKYFSLSGYGLSGTAVRDELYEFISRANADVGSITYGKYCDCYCFSEIDSSSGTLTGISINYWDRYRNADGSCDIEHVKKDQKTVTERFVAAKSLAKINMSDAERALVLYDYIISIGDYTLDENGSMSTDYPDDKYAVVGLLCDGSAVCAAYAKLYAILLNDAGLPALTVCNYDLKHEWVMVNIDGEWYHCDPTWDDVVFNEGYTALWDLNNDYWDRGACKHKCFLKSDDEIRETNHSDWELSYSVLPRNISDVPKSGSSGAFDDKFFSPNNEKFLCYTLMNYINGSWYFIDEKSMSIVNATYDGDVEYIKIPTDEVPKYSAGYGNYLYVCTNTAIFRYDTMSNKFEKILKIPDEQVTYCNFSEMSIVKDEMTVVTANYTFNDDHDFKDATFTVAAYPMSEIERMNVISSDDAAGDSDTDVDSDTRDTQKVPDVSITRPGNNTDKPALSDEDKAMIESAEVTGKRMMAFVYLGIAALFIVIAVIVIVIVIKYVRKK